MSLLRSVLVVGAVLLGGAGITLTIFEVVGPGVVLLLVAAALTTVVFLIGWGADAGEARRRRRQREAGIAGVARVLDVTPNGRFDDGSALNDVTLSVEVPGRPPYVTRVEQTSWLYLAPGRVTPVRVSRDDPHTVWIEYDPLFEAR
ncbi:hypothetical protein [Pseudonocardia sp. TRM90224]|uniref:hypothetical protein n=1 Tax=Pseudonocardia sp. TRM90224 TaxID=2812678 RepID=UPI001E651D92|nr:hypothetical protein [Pseudonocardia sp. TRM90224]